MKRVLLAVSLGTKNQLNGKWGSSMTFVEMGLQIILVSVSGVFPTGPLLFANLA